MIGSINNRISTCAILAVVLLVVACGADGGGSRQVELSVANHASAGDLADSSEYLVRGSVLGTSTKAIIDEDLEFVYMVSEVQIDDVLAQRPDVTVQLSADKSIRVGVSLLDLEQSDNVVNFGELTEEFPTTEQALVKDDHVLLFLVNTDYLEEPGPDYAAVGYGIIDKDGEIAWKGFPGDLADTKSDVATTLADVITRYIEPAPWRLTSEEPETRPDVGTEGRPPATTQPE